MLRIDYVNRALIIINLISKGQSQNLSPIILGFQLIVFKIAKNLVNFTRIKTLTIIKIWAISWKLYERLQLQWWVFGYFFSLQHLPSNLLRFQKGADIVEKHIIHEQVIHSRNVRFAMIIKFVLHVRSVIIVIKTVFFIIYNI